MNKIKGFSIKTNGSANLGLILFAFPALIFIALGVLSLIVPQFFAILISTFFIAIGTFLALLAWKLISLKRKVDSFIKKAGNTSVSINPGTGNGSFADNFDFEEFANKKAPKITYH